MPLGRRELIFSVNCFAAAMLALFASFALGLERPFWAMMTVYITSQPLSGAVRSKAVFRLAGTIVGAAATVILMPPLANSPVLLSLALAAWGQATDRQWQSLLFLALVSMQLGVAIGARPKQLTLANPSLPLAVAGSFLLALAGVYVPILQALLGTTALPLGDLVVATLTAPVGWCLARLTAAGTARRKVTASSRFATRH